MKLSKLLFVSMMIIGISLLTTFFVAWYCYYSNIYIRKIPILEQLFSMPYFLCLCLLGGPVLLIVGVWGTKISLIKRYRGLIVISIPIIVILLFGHMWVAGLNYSFSNSYAVRSEITQLTVVSNSPLALSLNVKAITDYDTEIYGAVVSCNGHDATGQKPIMTVYDEATRSYSNQSTIELPARSTILLTLTYTEKLRSGNYTILLLGGMHYNHASSLFTIP